ncbi:unnamed protein product [marine sediment metagenome]|uniref:Uncharacterized protein n=1 Tax=marine sediment metagenome TaxID=412755 RepID=X1MWK8_9ZZZZ
MLGTFITITTEDITSMIGYIKDFLIDLTPLLLPIVAVAVGIFIFWAIVKAIRP